MNDTIVLHTLCLELERIMIEMIGASAFNFNTTGAFTW
jgi:hypothetical protein